MRTEGRGPLHPVVRLHVAVPGVYLPVVFGVHGLPTSPRGAPRAYVLCYRQKLRHCDFLLDRFMFHNENLAEKRRPNSQCNTLDARASSSNREFAMQYTRRLGNYVLFALPQRPEGTTRQGTYFWKRGYR